MSNQEYEVNRRTFLTTATTVGLATTLGLKEAESAENHASDIKFIDTNVSLFQWPFRRLPLDNTQKLIQKLNSLGIEQAWAGSFEGILHRDISTVNQRLSEECKRFPQLISIGSINPTLPDWEHDLQQCFHEYQMPGVRLHPNYHGYTLEDPRLLKLLKLVAAERRFVQLAATLEDTRTQHQSVRAADVDLKPLPKLTTKVPRSQTSDPQRKTPS